MQKCKISPATSYCFWCFAWTTEKDWTRKCVFSWEGWGRFRDHAPDLTAQPGHKICMLFYWAHGRPDVDEGRIRAVDRPKSPTVSKATLSICLRMKLVASRSICKRVQLTLLTLSCQGITETTMRSGSAASKKKKKETGEAPRGPEQSTFKPTTICTKVSRLPPRLSFSSNLSFLRNPFCAWNRFVIPSKKVKKKKENKPGRRNFLVLHLQIANLYSGTNPLSTRRPYPAALSQGVPKRTRPAQQRRALGRVYNVPFKYVPTFLEKRAVHRPIAILNILQCIQNFFPKLCLILKEWFLTRFPPNFQERFLMFSASPEFVFLGPTIKQFCVKQV